MKEVVAGRMRLEKMPDAELQGFHVRLREPESRDHGGNTGVAGKLPVGAIGTARRDTVWDIGRFFALLALLALTSWSPLVEVGLRQNSSSWHASFDPWIGLMHLPMALCSVSAVETHATVVLGTREERFFVAESVTAEMICTAENRPAIWTHKIHQRKVTFRSRAGKVVNEGGDVQHPLSRIFIGRRGRIHLCGEEARRHILPGLGP